MSDIDHVLKDRGSRYGEFDEHARITQGIKAYMMSGVSWDRCNPAMKEALDMIAHKIGRIVNGDPYYEDSWVDIVGYSQLVVNDLRGLEKVDTRTMSPSEQRLHVDAQISGASRPASR